jgi:broad specificity phosphatase PhoE
MARIFVLVTALLTGLASDAVAQRAIFLVRHAEKVDDSDDSPISAVGVERAARLVAMLGDAGVTAIYGSERQRTIQTAQPLADRLGLEIGAIPRAETARLVETLRTSRADDVVLVVGHSDTLPGILRALGHPEDVTIGGSDYDNVFLVIPRDGAPPTLLRLKME